MLTIQLGPDPKTNQEQLLKKLCQNAEDGITGQILLVPEQASHTMEYRLCQMGGAGICRSAEVLSFTRLASRVFSLYGGVCRQTLDQGGRLLAMSQAVAQVHTRLRLFAGKVTKAEFLTMLLDVVEELTHDCISPAMLRGAAGQATGQFAQKLTELALIYESYQTVCAGGPMDPLQKLDLLTEKLQEAPFAAGRRIFVSGFSDFTRQELAVLERLLTEAEQLTVSFVCQEAGGVAFQSAQRTVKTLRALAGRHGIVLETESVPASLKKAPGLLFLQKQLFAPGAAACAQDTGAITLIRCQTSAEECQAAVGKILELLRKGVRLREIAVVYADGSMGAPLGMALRRFSIPAYFSGDRPILEKPAVQMLCRALRAASSGMEQEDVLAYLKSPLLPLDREMADKLENYGILWNLHGSRWQAEWTLNPNGMGSAMDEQAETALKALNAARRTAVEPLCRLKGAIGSGRTIGEKTVALWRFVEEIALSEQLARQARRLTEEGQLQKAQEQQQLYEILCAGLEQMYRVLGPIPSTPEEFSRMTEALLSQYQVGTIPAALDTVSAGGLMEMRESACRYLFLLGADEGTLPAYQGEAGLLSEEDRKRLQGLGLPVLPDDYDPMEREFSAIYQVLSAPSEGLFVSFHSEKPAYLVQRMEELLSLTPENGGQTLWQAAAYCPAELGALLAAGQVSDAELTAYPPPVRQEVFRIRQKASYCLGRLERENVAALYGKTLALSASRIDKYAACRFAFFLEYGLKARARKPARLDAPIYGTFVHSVLEETVKQAQQEGGFRQLPRSRLEQIAGQAMERYLTETLSEFLQTERSRALLKKNFDEVRLVAENLFEELSASSFQPTWTELEFSSRGAIPPVMYETELGACQISGFVDRVDLFTRSGRTYVRVVDYKTGKKTFDYTDVLNGVGLQMLIYLFALRKYGPRLLGEELIPAGVLYMPARVPVLSLPGKLSAESLQGRRDGEFQRKGLLLQDPAVLDAMEPGYQQASRFLPVKTNAKGETLGDLASPEQLDLLERFVQKTVCRLADAIFQGEVSPNPVFRGADHGMCTYCDYAHACHLKSQVTVRVMEKTSREEFWQRVERQVRNHE